MQKVKKTPTRLFDLLDNQRDYLQKEICLAHKTNGFWAHYSSREVSFTATALASGLLKIHQIKKGDKIALISMNRPEWSFVDYAVLKLGGVIVPLYPTSSLEDFQFVLSHCECRILFVSTKELYDKINSLKSELPKLEAVYSFDEIGSVKHWSELTEKYKKEKDDAAVFSASEQVEPKDLASLIYTSGTTGTPKGVMLTHENILSNVGAVEKILPIDATCRALSFLPLCHIYERMVNYVYMYLGVSIYYAESIDAVAENLKEVKPDIFVTVPRLLEKIYEKIIARGNGLTGTKKELFDWALKLGLEFDLDQKTTFRYKAELNVARKLVFSKWREALGGNIRAVVSGGAALQPRLAKIFWAAGVPVLEGYGLTETSPVIAVNCMEKGMHKVGTVGPLLTNVEVKIAPEPGYRDGEGEICVKGPNIMQGYFKNEEATREVIDHEGWFHTGDIGMLVDGKFLKITDRKKEVFKTSGGKYIAPLFLEGKLKESQFIEQLMVVGDGQKFPGAIIVPSFLNLREWCKTKSIPYTTDSEMIKNPKVIEKITREVEIANEAFGQVEKIKKFELVSDEWTPGTGELTPKLSLKRRVLKEKYRDLIEKIYAD